MNSLQSICGTVPGTLLFLVQMILVVGQLTILTKSIRRRRRGMRVLPDLLHFAAGFLLLALMLQCVYELEIRQGNAPAAEYYFEEVLLSLPWSVFVLLELLSAGLLVFRIVKLFQFDREHLPPGAVKEALDLLPAGVMICDEQGKRLFSNLRMNFLRKAIAGSAAASGDELWDAVVMQGKAQEESRLVSLPGGSWLFSRRSFSLDREGTSAEEHRTRGRSYICITASDVTGRSLVAKKLEGMNRHLREVQYRMKSVAARERELVSAREIMNARMTVHNQMGSVLLAGKYYLDHPEGMREAELVRLLEYNNHFLLGEAEEPVRETDPIREAVRTAGRIGVKVKLEGTVPVQGIFRELLAEALEQCAANTVRHAGGDSLTVRVAADDVRVFAVFTNNGTPPEEPVTETGGLAGLREAVESAGGIMRVESAPVFRLTFSVPVMK